MKRKLIKIPLYEVKLYVLEVEDPNDLLSVKRSLKRFKVPDSIINPIINDIEDNKFNGGNLIRDLNSRRLIMVLHKSKSPEDRAAVIGHEKRHVEDRILEYFGINDIESSAILAGFLSKKLL